MKIPRWTRLLALTTTVLIIIGPSAISRPEPVEASYLQRMGYYVYYDETSWQRLQEQISQLDIVAPYFFHLTPSGTIKELDSRADDVTTFVHSHNKKVIPIIQNESRWDDFTKTIGTPDKQNKIVRDLTDLFVERGYDGIQIDFEGVNATDSDLMTAFMTRLSESFRQHGLIVSQAVIARTSDAPSVWGGAYDYEALARLTDFISIMAYDYHAVGSETPGAVAPYWWVDSVLDYAVKRIPRAQIFLGVPFYGRDWNTTDGPPADNLVYEQAMELTQRENATSGFSEDDQTPWIRYTDENGDKHEVWYENSLSLEKKLELALDYGIGGFSAWRIGQEDPDSWRVIANLETPATPVEPGEDTATSRYFPETGHWLRDEFLAYWDSHGGLAQFGFPRTEAFVEFDPLVGESYLVQYFERARFEHHPEFEGTEHEVLLGHIGRWALAKRGLDPWETAVDPVDGRTYFPESGHTLGGAFQAYWESHGGLFQFGYPLTEEITEISPEDGGTYVVQYFERARMELHTELGDEPMVLLGLLGNEMLRERGWIR